MGNTLGPVTKIGQNDLTSLAKGGQSKLDRDTVIGGIQMNNNLNKVLDRKQSFSIS